MNPSPHIQRLVDKGYDVEIIQDRWLLLKRVPYLNKDLEIRYGSLVSDIEMSGNDVKVNLSNHPIYFIGEQPYRIDGVKLNPNNSNRIELLPGLFVDFYYSYKLDRPYTDYFEKMSHYVHIFSKHAISKDPSVTFNVGSLTIVPDNLPFRYSDCNSASPEGIVLMQKFLEMKIGIIGLGGTGSYILDFISKTPVKEIHLFDGDYLHNKNAFRSPGAVSIDDLKNIQRKTDYYEKEYSRIHENIISHSEFIKPENLNILDQLSFVFISIDKSEVKKMIVEYLESKKIGFIDVGMGIQIVEGAILGVLRTTLSTEDERDHVHKKQRIKFGENPNNEYSSLPQIAELNGLNAAFAVIKWKKLIGFYHDREMEYHSQYLLPNNKIINNDYKP
ncbi:MAG: ThiF family adenylyltransferase [Bacteroidales bacterium]|nr:ThiF family adenylyltransferase [Bacteroidales bacterium]